MAFIQTLPIDLAILFAGDTLMYLEFVVMIRLVAGREHIRAMLRFVARLTRLAIRLSRAAVDVSISRINHVRERRTARSQTSPYFRSIRRRRRPWGQLGRAGGRVMTARQVSARRPHPYGSNAFGKSSNV
jgi:hypothetical protein